jgi:A/G-specific adenine glycosylase
VTRAAPRDASLAARVVRWQRRSGRSGLPWHAVRDPYRVWLSEVMLQQTQVSTALAYYERFVRTYPDVTALAAAPLDDVLALWSRLGYYSRARNLHRCAQAIVAEHGGAFPRSSDELAKLPGIGRSTAAAIAGFAFGARGAILDGNVKRVLARHFAVDGYPGERAVEQHLWRLAESLLPATDIEPYIQGLMDLGATVCTTRAPQCARCPVRASCAALAQNRVGALPSPRPRRAVPHRRTAMLLLRRGNDILLQKRPGVGVWSGLWCFPEIGPDEDPARVAKRLYGCEVASVERLGLLRHGFTHFTLDIEPVVVRVGRVAPRAAQPGVLWLPLGEAIGAAVPVPVRKLLRVLAKGSALADQPALFEELIEDLETR